jgi:hypothetical protein
MYRLCKRDTQPLSKAEWLSFQLSGSGSRKQSSLKSSAQSEPKTIELLLLTHDGSSRTSITIILYAHAASTAVAYAAASTAAAITARSITSAGVAARYSYGCCHRVSSSAADAGCNHQCKCCHCCCCCCCCCFCGSSLLLQLLFSGSLLLLFLLLLLLLLRATWTAATSTRLTVLTRQ